MVLFELSFVFEVKELNLLKDVRNVHKNYSHASQSNINLSEVNYNVKGLYLDVRMGIAVKLRRDRIEPNYC